MGRGANGGESQRLGRQFPEAQGWGKCAGAWNLLPCLPLWLRDTLSHIGLLQSSVMGMRAPCTMALGPTCTSARMERHRAPGEAQSKDSFALSFVC